MEIAVLITPYAYVQIAHSHALIETVPGTPDPCGSWVKVKALVHSLGPSAKTIDTTLNISHDFMTVRTEDGSPVMLERQFTLCLSNMKGLYTFFSSVMIGLPSMTVSSMP